MKGLDLSKFSKVSTDEKKTVFKHKDGHWLHVAHKGLSPGYRKQLGDLPAYAGGGDVEDTADETYMPSEPVPEIQGYHAPQAEEVPVVEQDPANRAEQAAEMANGPTNPYTAIQPVLGAKQQEYKAAMDAIKADEGPVSGDPGPARHPDSSSMDPAAHQAPMQQSMPPQASIQDANAGPDPMAAQEAEKDKGAAQEYQKGFADYHRENAQKLGAEDAAWQHDLQNGHVTPETYHDLFAKKDTLGKIGTLFGLLVSGAGSGLAHQSNAVMDAMNKEIENDLSAQKQSKDNAQNFLKIHQAQALNEANIGEIGAKTGLAIQQARSAAAEADINAQAATLMKMNRTALHNLVLQVQKLPQGPQRAQAEAALAMVSAGVDQKNFDIADVAAGKGAMAKLSGLIGNGAGTNTTLLRTMPGMEGVANDIDQKTIPGVGRTQIPVPQNKRDELEAMNVLDYKAKDLLAYAKQHKGSLDPRVRAVGAQKAEEMMNYYNNSIKGGVLTEGRLKWLDQQIKKNPTSIFQDVLGNNSRMNEIMESNAQRKNLMLQNLGAPAQKQAAPDSQQTSKSGRPMVQKNGKWYYAK